MESATVNSFLAIFKTSKDLPNLAAVPFYWPHDDQLHIHSVDD